MLLKVKLDSRAKGSWFGVRPKAIWSCALKVRKGTVVSGWTKSHAAKLPRCQSLFPLQSRCRNQVNLMLRCNGSLGPRCTAGHANSDTSQSQRIDRGAENTSNFSQNPHGFGTLRGVTRGRLQSRLFPILMP